MANSVPSSYPRYPKRHSKREKKVIETALSASGAYTPNDAEDWGEPAPTSIVAAIDTLAARVQALEDAAQ